MKKRDLFSILFYYEFESLKCISFTNINATIQNI